MIQFLEDMKGQGKQPLSHAEREELEGLRKEHKRLQEKCEKKGGAGAKKKKDSDASSDSEGEKKGAEEDHDSDDDVSESKLKFQLSDRISARLENLLKLNSSELSLIDIMPPIE
jgi:hypothetical protein